MSRPCCDCTASDPSGTHHTNLDTPCRPKTRDRSPTETRARDILPARDAQLCATSNCSSTSMNHRLIP